MAADFFQNKHSKRSRSWKTSYDLTSEVTQHHFCHIHLVTWASLDSAWANHLESDTTERLHLHFSLFTFMHWRRKWQPTPVFLPGESQGWGILVGCRLCGRTELDTTEMAQQQGAVSHPSFNIPHSFIQNNKSSSRSRYLTSDMTFKVV